MSELGTIMEFRYGRHVVCLVLKENGAYDIEVTVIGNKIVGNQTFVEATLIDRTLAVHCFNHTVEQYQKEAL